MPPRARRDLAHGPIVSYSRKVFVPLTKLCRDVCHYCTFAQPPRTGESRRISRSTRCWRSRAPDRRRGLQGSAVHARRQARAALRGGSPRARSPRPCHHDLVSGGGGAGRARRDRTAAARQPRSARRPPIWRRCGACRSRRASCSRARRSGCASRAAPHHGSPDKHPAARLETIRLAGEQRVPFTTGILIGIGETRQERIEALLALRSLHETYGHIQEIIIQNFRPEARDADGRTCRPASLDEHLWTIAVARLLFAPEMNIQAPPNLSARRAAAADRRRHQRLGRRLAGHARPRQSGGAVAAPAGARARDERRRQGTRRAAGDLSELRAIAEHLGRSGLRTRAAAPHRCRRLAAHRRLVAGHGHGRCPAVDRRSAAISSRRRTRSCRSCEKASAGRRLDEHEIVRLFRARGDEFAAVCAAADALRRETNGDTISYVVTRNINYTNICYFKCQFCAFSKGKLSENLRGKPVHALARRDRPARARGMGARRDRSLHAGRHPPELHRPDVSRYLPRREARLRPASMSTRSRRSKCIRAPRRSACRSTSSSQR